MMSLFSSFDALCGETYGYKFKFSAAPKVESSSSSSSSSVVQSAKNNGEDNSKSTTHNENRSSKSSSAPAHVRQDRKKTMPRFAPEFDGVHCFETIIPC